ncbi:MAG: hypothetical protein AAFW81_10050 [Pseudomonadota bacterium]
MTIAMRATVFLLCIVAIAPARAQGPDGFSKFYDAPTQVNLGGRPVVAEIALYTDENAEPETLRMALVTDVTGFIEETERDLENWIATRQDRCGERWNAGDPYIGFPTGAIRFRLDLQYEFYQCGWNGQGAPWRVVREAGAIDVTLNALVIDGRLQTALDNLTISEQAGVNQFLPLEFVTRRVLASELQTLNENPKFYRAPQPFHREGFVYEAIAAKREDGRVVITATYVADGDAGAYERIVAALREDGIYSER